jgi:penicillin-binding protein 2
MSTFNQSRGLVIKLIIGAAFLILGVRLFQLQVISKDFGALADNQAYFKKIIVPSRGLLLDRFGKKMVENFTVFDLQVTPNAIKGMDTLAFCRIMGIDTATFNKKINDCIHYKNGRSKASVFYQMLSMETQLKLEEKMYAFPGFDLVQRTERTYPFNSGGNVFGYLNEASQAMINNSGYLQSGEITGINGLERYYDRTLRGERGVEIYIRDGKQRIMDHYKDGKFDTTAVAGRSLKTFMDIKVQQLAEKLMANKLGAAVAIEPKTGGIIAMATGPGYDPNLLSGNQKRQNLGRLLTDVTMVTFNFATQGEYQPGSTFKPLGALVALDEGVMQPSSGVGCGGRYHGCGGKGVACHGGGHGGNLRNAMAASCNSYFITTYRKALENPQYNNIQAGYLQWKDYMTKFGLGKKLGIDLPSERGGNIPDTGGKRGLNKSIGSTSWGSCATMTMGIGQDRMLTTPLQMANAMCIVANKGYYYIPHFVDSIVGETKKDTLLAKYRRKIETVHIPDSSFDAVIDGMEAVVTSGTARKSAIKGISMCGKTGTAENSFKGKQQEEHSWFVCFAPKQDPKIAVAVCVLNAGQGGQYAAPIASLIVEQYLTDTIKRKSLMTQMANKKIIPGYLKQMKYEQDSAAAYDRFEATGDSSYIMKYLPPEVLQALRQDSIDAVNKLKPQPIKNEKDSSSIKAKKPNEAVLPKKTTPNGKVKDTVKKKL